MFFGKYSKKGKKRRNTYAKKRRVAGGRKSSVSIGIKKYVKKAIHSQIENKRIEYSRTFSFGGNTTTYSNLSVSTLTPSSVSYNMSQGTGQADRIGNKIRIINAVLRYILLPISYDLVGNPTPKPQEVQILFGNVKGNTRTTPTSGQIAYLFANGNSSTGPTGLLGDVLRPINSDFWVIKKRIQHKVGYAVSDGTGGSAGSQYQSNNDFPINVVRSLNVTKMMPKQIVWNESDTNPTTAGLYMMIQAVNADNTSQLADTAPSAMTFWLDITYEDA